jgi:deoxyribonuclease-4
VRLGAQVRAGPNLLEAIEHAEELGAEAVQVFLQSSRAWRLPAHRPEVLAAYRAASARRAGGLPTFCHAPYLINLASPDPERFERSRAALGANLAEAQAMGAAGLVLHPGSHLGAGLEPRLDQLAGALVEALEEHGGGCPILLENTAGAGGTIGRSLEELARILEAAGDHRGLGVCLDTQHLWAAGISFGTMADADTLVRRVERTVGLERLACLHVNDSVVGFGAGRDRHANLGEGDIGLERLACLLGHPALDGLAAVLEVPGAGQGPRARDVAVLRQTYRSGVARRAGLAPRSFVAEAERGGPTRARREP